MKTDPIEKETVLWPLVSFLTISDVKPMKRSSLCLKSWFIKKMKEGVIDGIFNEKERLESCKDYQEFNKIDDFILPV